MKYRPRIIEHQGRAWPIKELAFAHGLTVAALYSRLYVNGWPLERALAQPLGRHRVNTRRARPF